MKKISYPIWSIVIFLVLFTPLSNAQVTAPTTLPGKLKLDIQTGTSSETLIFSVVNNESFPVVVSPPGVNNSPVFINAPDGVLHTHRYWKRHSRTTIEAGSSTEWELNLSALLKSNQKIAASSQCEISWQITYSSPTSDQPSKVVSLPFTIDRTLRRLGSELIELKITWASTAQDSLLFTLSNNSSTAFTTSTLASNTNKIIINPQARQPTLYFSNDASNPTVTILPGQKRSWKLSKAALSPNDDGSAKSNQIIWWVKEIRSYTANGQSIITRGREIRSTPFAID